MESSNRIVQYLKDSKTEMKKVTWPTKKETTKHTLIVIGVSLAVAVFLGALDFIFSKLISFVI